MLWLTTTIPFFVATWEEFHLDALWLPIINGPSEGIVMTTLVYLLAGYLGNMFWQTPLPFELTIPVINVTISQYRHTLVYLTMFVAVMTVLFQVCVCFNSILLFVMTRAQQIANVLRKLRHEGDEPLRALGMTSQACVDVQVDLTDETGRLWPMATLVTAGTTWIIYSPELYHAHPRLFLVTMGFIFTDITVRERTS